MDPRRGRAEYSNRGARDLSRGRHPSHERPRWARCCDEDLLHAVLRDHRVEVVDRSHDRNAVDRAPPERVVVVDDRDGNQSEDRIVLHLSERGCSFGAGPDHRDSVSDAHPPVAAEREQAALKPSQAHQERREERSGNQHRDRDVALVPAEDQQQHDSTGETGKDQPTCLVDARVSPCPPVTAPEQRGPELHDAGDREEHSEVLPVMGRHGEVEPDEEDDRVCDERHHEIEQREGDVAPHAARGARQPKPNRVVRPRVCRRHPTPCGVCVPAIAIVAFVHGT